MRTPRARRVLLTVVAVGTALTACTQAPPAARESAPQDTGTLARPQDGIVRPATTPKGLIPGIDVSAYQPNMDWTAVKADGAKFAYIKATEGTSYKSSTFTRQYNGAAGVGIVHGAYHFATPNTSSGKSQADYFVAHGGGGKADGHTLPGVLDIEKNPYGSDQCYDMSHAKMDTWISDFLHEYHARTGRYALINTFRDWWITCTGNAGAKPGSVFGTAYPLWVNDHKASAGKVPIPAAWKSYTIWQWTDRGTYGDEDYIRSSAVYKALLAR